MGCTRSHGRRDDTLVSASAHRVSCTTARGAPQEHMLTLSGTERLLQRLGECEGAVLINLVCDEWSG